MRVAVGLLALLFLGADKPPAHSVSSITYDLVLLEMNGVEWRSAVYPRLQPVARQGSATVWTAPATVAQHLKGKAARVLATPRLVANSGTTAYLSNKTTRNYVTEMTRYADGPVNHASFLAYAPKIENAREGMAATFTGRKLDQGVLTQFVLEDTRVNSLHNVALSEEREVPRGEVTKTAGPVHETLNFQIQVPEVARVNLAGEWLIPNDGVLVVSLGAYTAADEAGKAVVRERVAVVEVRASDTDVLPTSLSTTVNSIPSLAPQPVAISRLAGERAKLMEAPADPFGPAPMPAPAVPSRSLPTPLDTEGNPVALPPLPQALQPPTALPGSSDPCATPQIHHFRSAEPLPERRSEVHDLDADSTRTGFSTDDEACDAESFPEAAGKDRPVALSFDIPLRGGLLPFKGQMTIQIHRARGPEFAAPAPPKVVEGEPAKRD